MTAVQNAGPTADDLAYIRFRAPDLEKMRVFLEDFGFKVMPGETEDGVPALFSRGKGGAPVIHIVEQGDPTFLGIGFKMASMESLKALSEYDGASEICEILAPGGGYRVRFEDPNGYAIDGVYGYIERAQAPPFVRQPMNTMAARLRRNSPIRLPRDKPVPVNRIGHCVLNVRSFRGSEAWFKERFGLLTSEEFYVDDKSQVVGGFLRCNRGDIPTDHHTVALVQSQQTGINHVAFEVDDWDSVMLGHDYLGSKGYKSYWGVGKHILGSQIFDYWEDPYGNVHEHFTDGDLFDQSHVPTLESVDNLLGVQWGPLPPDKDL